MHHKDHRAEVLASYGIFLIPQKDDTILFDFV